MTVTAVLGIDPGNSTGWAVVTIEPNPRLITYGIYRLTHVSKRQAESQEATPSEQIRVVKGDLFRDHGMAVQAVVLEDQYSSPKNPRAGIKIGRTSGRWLEACAVAGLEVNMVEPSRWQHRLLKGLLPGRTATREQRKRAAKVRAVLAWDVDLPSDIADAAYMALYTATIIRRTRLVA